LSQPGEGGAWDRVGGEKIPPPFPGLGFVCCDAASVAQEALHLPERAQNLTGLQCRLLHFRAPRALRTAKLRERIIRERKSSCLLDFKGKTIRPWSVCAFERGRIEAAPEPDGIL